MKYMSRLGKRIRRFFMSWNFKKYDMTNRNRPMQSKVETKILRAEKYSSKSFMYDHKYWH